MADAVANASPLIALANGGHPDLVLLAGDRVLVPRAVADEILRRGQRDPTVRLLSGGTVHLAANPSLPPALLTGRLGPGESAVIALGLAEPSRTLILDDLAARRFAIDAGLKVRGTLSLVVQARQRGIIASIRPVIDDLRRAGLFLPEALVQRLIAQAGE
jgi:hypothetical protein